MNSYNIAKAFFFICAGISVIILVEEYFCNDPKVYEVRTCQDLQDMRNDLEGTYILMNNIDGSECSKMVALPPLEGEYLNDE
jgi:hypothetical protein